MAFLAKKVPKIFPSKTKKGHEDILSSNHCKPNNKKSAFLFRKISRDSKEADHAPQTPEPNHHNPGRSLPKPQSPDHQSQTTKHRSEALECDVDCSGNLHHNHHNHCGSSSHGHSSASTLESSPTLTPRETMDPTLLVLPDLPKLAFPFQNGKGSETNDKAQQFHNYHNNHNNPTATIPIPSSLRLVPRPALQQQQEEEQEDEEELHNDDRPPVALVSVPMEFAFPPPPPPLPPSTFASSPNHHKMVVASGLTRPPPRAGEWDDATIESHVLFEEEEQEPQQEESQQQTAQAIMKPWIERAARLALLQNKVCGNLVEAPPQQQTNLLRNQKAALLNLRPRPERNSHHHRALLASLEQRSTTTPTTAAAAAAAAPRTNTQDASASTTLEHPVPSAPRIVKWHVVRQPCCK